MLDWHLLDDVVFDFVPLYDETLGSNDSHLIYNTKDLQSYLERLNYDLQHIHANSDWQSYYEALKDLIADSGAAGDLKIYLEKLSELLSEAEIIEADIYGSAVYDELNKADTFQTVDSVNDELLKTIAKLRFLLTIKD